MSKEKTFIEKLNKIEQPALITRDDFRSVLTDHFKLDAKDFVILNSVRERVIHIMIHKNVYSKSIDEYLNHNKTVGVACIIIVSDQIKQLQYFIRYINVYGLI